MMEIILTVVVVLFILGFFIGLFSLVFAPFISVYSSIKQEPMGISDNFPANKDEIPDYLKRVDKERKSRNRSALFCAFFVQALAFGLPVVAVYFFSQVVANIIFLIVILLYIYSIWILDADEEGENTATDKEMNQHSSPRDSLLWAQAEEKRIRERHERNVYGPQFPTDKK